MRHHDLVLLVLAGLGDEYESLIQNVSLRSEPVTYRMLRSMLMDIDTWQKQSNLSDHISVNAVIKSLENGGKI